MLCKDCKESFLVVCKECKAKTLICLVNEKPEVINSKYYEDEEGCEGM